MPWPSIDLWQIAGRQVLQTLFTKTSADKLTVKTIFHCADNPATAAVLFFDEMEERRWDGVQERNVLIFDFDRDDRIQNLTVVFDTFPGRGKL